MNARVISAAVMAVVLSGCLTNRTVSSAATLDLPNTITQRGFRYVKRAIEMRYEVKGFFPADLKRPEAAGHMEIALQAYDKLVAQADGVSPTQALVNVAVEAALIKSSAGEMYLVVSMYADKIEFTTKGASAADEANQKAIARIQQGVAQALPVG